jgi:WD40 repeat protein
VVTGAEDGTVLLWNVARPASPRRLARVELLREPKTPAGQVNQHAGDANLHAGRVNQHAISQIALAVNGRSIAVGYEHAIRVLDVTDPEHPRDRPQAPAPADMRSVSLTSDGRSAALVDANGTVTLRVLSGGRRRDRRIPIPGGRSARSGIASTTMGPDGRTFVTGQGGAAMVWNVPERKRPPQVATLVTGELAGQATFSPDGRSFAALDVDGTVSAWRVGPRPQRLLQFPANGVTAMAIAPKAGLVATTGDDHTIILWRSSDPSAPTRLIREPLRDAGPVESMAFSADGRRLVTATTAGSGRIWDLSNPLKPDPMPPFGKPEALTRDRVRGRRVAFSRDGRMAAVPRPDGTVTLWDLSDSQNPQELKGVEVGPPAEVGDGAVALQPRGRLLATAAGGTVLMWDVADPRHPRQLEVALQVPGSFAEGAGAFGSKGSVVLDDAAFSADGKLLVGTVDRTVAVWDVSQLEREGADVRLKGTLLPQIGRDVGSIAVSPDRRTLAVIDGGTMSLWDFQDPLRASRIGQPLAGAFDSVDVMAFDATEGLLVTGSRGAVSLWDLTDPGRAHRLGRSLAVPADDVIATAFSPDGRVLAAGLRSGEARGGIMLWNIAGVQNLRRHAVKRACELVGPRYSPGPPYRQTCPAS